MSSKKKTLDQSVRIPGKTTYILGAGFSALAGLPVLSKFIPEAMKRLKHYSGKGKKKELANQLASILNTYTPAAHSLNINLDNLEDLFCLIDLPRTGAKLKKDELSEEQVIKQVIVTVLDDCYESPELEVPTVPRRHLLVNPQNPSSDEDSTKIYGVSAYEAFLANIVARNSEVIGQHQRHFNEHDLLLSFDTVITLNYDMVLEETAKRFDNMYIHYGRGVLKNTKDVISNTGKPTRIRSLREADHVLPMLKLHGSINWKSTGSSKSAPSTIRIDRKYSTAYIKAKDPRTVPVIVPPTWRKTMEEQSVHFKLAQAAMEHLRLSERIVIIGYSLGKADKYFKYMLAKSLSTPEFPSIEVWDIIEREVMKKTLKRNFGSNNLGKRVAYCPGEEGKPTGFLGFVRSIRQPNPANSG